MSALPLLEGLPPIVGGNPRLLILGNMPSVTSLESRQYYGNPRNAFWRIVADLLDIEAEAAYPERVAVLQRHGVAVWDVLLHCRRSGSLDSAVERDSMVANDFAAFFNQHRTISRVFFNGAAAEQNYLRLVGRTEIHDYTRLPSTSPAHTMSYADKLAAWTVLTQ